ncbi:MAG: hypothetical protein JW860_10110 [Sedimentisphaerales bacterium]|nr:hypothetical protein [Sedimentisphaerales bacterium]
MRGTEAQRWNSGELFVKGGERTENSIHNTYGICLLKSIDNLRDGPLAAHEGSWSWKRRK